MTDVRALLKAKRQEARISHPYAAYSSSGQLRCIPCGTPVKQASMWEGHIGSKAHRTAVVKMRAREEAEAAAAREEEELRKRKQSEEMDEDDGEEARSSKKSRVDEDVPMETSTTRTPKGFPAGFFSDPSRALVLDDDDDDNEGETQSNAQTTTQPKTQLDLEYEQFQATVVSADAMDEEKEEDRKEAYARATVFAEPELLTNGREGLPTPVGAEDAEPDIAEPAKEETEEEKRKRLELEERELIMDRLIEEERAQEEADSRVSLLKAKVEALKKAREMRRGNKAEKTAT